MTYIPRRDVTTLIENKFEAIRVLALECRRLNDELRAREASTDRKISTMAVKRLLDGKVRYYDARERREQERSEAMLAAAEGMLDAQMLAMNPDSDVADLSEGSDEPAAEVGQPEPVAEAASEAAAPAAAAEEEK